MAREILIASAALVQSSKSALVQARACLCLISDIHEGTLIRIRATEETLRRSDHLLAALSLVLISQDTARADGSIACPPPQTHLRP